MKKPIRLYELVQQNGKWLVVFYDDHNDVWRLASEKGVYLTFDAKADAERKLLEIKRNSTDYSTESGTFLIRRPGA